jgi:hypothetical protein
LGPGTVYHAYQNPQGKCTHTRPRNITFAKVDKRTTEVFDGHKAQAVFNANTRMWDVTIKYAKESRRITQDFHKSYLQDTNVTLALGDKSHGF